MQGEVPAQNISSLSHVLRAVGGLTKPSGRGLFMFQCLIAGSSSAALLGLFGASLLGYTLTAGAVGFVGGSCLGFIVGAVGYYRTSYDQSLVAFMKYPDLIRHHLFTDLGMHGVRKIESFWREDRERTIREIRGSMALQGMLISAWHSAIPAIEDIQNREEDQLVSNYEQRSESEGKD